MIALPSKGAIAEPTLAFLQECGLRVEKPNPRQYTGIIPAIPNLDVLFQRVIDVQYKVANGTAQLGITGLDVVAEYADDEVLVIHDNLRYGYCRLVVAVPETWVDVSSMLDLAEVALDYREYKRRDLRVATSYPNQARSFLRANGIHHFQLVNAEGAIEAAPTIGYADIIVDLVQTGTTLRENHLKPLPDGVIIESQACLIGNKTALQTQPALLETTRILVEHMDAAIQGRGYSQVTVNICGESAESIARDVAAQPLTRGLQGPTIAPIYGAEVSDGGRWFTITIIVANKTLLSVVEVLRGLGGTQTTVIPVRYVFLEQSATYTKLLDALNR